MIWTTENFYRAFVHGDEYVFLQLTKTYTTAGEKTQHLYLENMMTKKQWKNTLMTKITSGS